MILFMFAVIFSINCAFATSTGNVHKNMSSVSTLSTSNSQNHAAAVNTTKKAAPAKVKTSYNKVAIILPHADDETIGAGGWIQYLKSHGKQVHSVLITSGNAVNKKLLTVRNYYNIKIPKKASASYRKGLIREDSFKKVMKIYGCPYTIIGCDDGKSTSKLVFNVMESMYKKGYGEFYTTTGDGNIDHLNCQNAMKKMLKKYPKLKYRQFPIYWYHYGRNTPMPLVNHYKEYNVCKYSYKKLQAFKVYYNIHTLLSSFYPYSCGTIRASPERIYYVN